MSRAESTTTNGGSKWKDRKRNEQLPYHTLKSHRDALLAAEFQYLDKIKELEKRNEDMSQLFANTTEENVKLKTIIEHGPYAVRMKHFQIKREKQILVHELQKEIVAFQNKIRELETYYGIPDYYTSKRDWADGITHVRYKKGMDAEETKEEHPILEVSTQGPFVGTKVLKSKRVAIDDARSEDHDTYDISLEHMERETKHLLNKIKQLKQEKDQIDYAMIMGKGNFSKNAAVADRINERLNRDLNRFALKLEDLKIKHEEGKKRLVQMTKPKSEDILEISGDPVNEGMQKPVKSHKSKVKRSPVNTMENDDFKYVNYLMENVNTSTPKPFSRRSSNTSNQISLSARESKFKGPRNELTKRRTSSADRKDFTQMKEETPKNTSVDKRRPSVGVLTRTKTPKKFVPLEYEQKVRNQKMRRLSSKQSLASVTSTTRPQNKKATKDVFAEPVSLKRNANTYPNLLQTINEKTETSDIQADTYQLKRNPKGFPTMQPQINGPISFPFRRQKRVISKSENDITTYDDVLSYIERPSTGIDIRSKKTGTRTNAGADDSNKVSPPLPIPFRSEMKIVDRHGLRNVIGNSGLRGPEYIHDEYVAK